jgi:pimeloyl-ACP methyl ester carboxylesterase
MPYFVQPNSQIYYEWVPARGDRPVIVFIHGWGGSSRYWRSTAMALSEQFDCLIYDLKGFGKSTLTETETEFTLSNYADELAELLQHLKIEHCHLISHSMGSSIGALFLDKYPQMVDRAILTCAGVFEYDERAFKIFSFFGRFVVQVRPRWLTQLPGMDRIVMQRFLHRDIPQRDRQEFLEDYLQATDAAALGTVYDVVNEANAIALPKAFKGFLMPVLMISGEYDRIIPVALAKPAAALNDRVNLKVMPDVGHFPMLEDGTTFVKMIQDFLAE